MHDYDFDTIPTPFPNKFKSDDFVNAICQIDSLKMLDAAVLNADESYIWARNASIPRLAMNLLLVPALARYYRASTYIDNYAVQKTKTQEPKELLVALLIGPTETLSQGGAGLNSFKWLLVQELSKLMSVTNKDITPITDKEAIERYGITEDTASQIIGSIITKLRGPVAEKAKNTNR